MIIGFDYFKTLTTHHQHFKLLAQLVKESGGSVFVISALSDQADKAKYERAMEKFFKDTNFPYTNYHVVVFPKGKEAEHIPVLKLQKAQELNVQVFFDDRADVVEMMAEYGITGCHVKNWFPKTGLDNGSET